MTVGAFTSHRLFTVAEYHLMADAGIFTEDDRVELIEGEVVTMSPIGPRHAGTVTRLAGIADVWLVDLVTNVVEVCSSPTANGYAKQQRFGRGATTVSEVVPELTVPVAEILIGCAFRTTAAATRTIRT